MPGPRSRWTRSWQRRWPAREAAPLDHGERETAIAGSGRELQRQVPEATFAVDSAREERSAPLVSAAGIRHGTVEKGCGPGCGEHLRAGPRRADGVPQRAGGEPVPGGRAVGPARGPLLAGDARTGRVSPG